MLIRFSLVSAFQYFENGNDFRLISPALFASPVTIALRRLSFLRYFEVSVSSNRRYEQFMAVACYRECVHCTLKDKNLLCEWYKKLLRQNLFPIFLDAMTCWMLSPYMMVRKLFETKNKQKLWSTLQIDIATSVKGETCLSYAVKHCGSLIIFSAVTPYPLSLFLSFTTSSQVLCRKQEQFLSMLQVLRI